MPLFESSMACQRACRSRLAICVASQVALADVVFRRQHVVHPRAHATPADRAVLDRDAIVEQRLELRAPADRTGCVAVCDRRIPGDPERDARERRAAAAAAGCRFACAARCRGPGARPAAAAPAIAARGRRAATTGWRGSAAALGSARDGSAPATAPATPPVVRPPVPTPPVPTPPVPAPPVVRPPLPAPPGDAPPLATAVPPEATEFSAPLFESSEQPPAAIASAQPIRIRGRATWTCNAWVVPSRHGKVGRRPRPSGVS